MGGYKARRKVQKMRYEGSFSLRSLVQRALAAFRADSVWEVLFSESGLESNLFTWAPLGAEPARSW
jgi:hypothetical protein